MPLCCLYSLAMFTCMIFQRTFFFFFLKDAAPTEFSPLPPHAPLPLSARRARVGGGLRGVPPRRCPVLVGRSPGPAQQPRVGLVRRLVQLPRRGRRHRRDRLRREIGRAHV